MLNKPEIFENIGEYGMRISYEYDSLAKKLDRLDIEILDTIINYVYKEGMKAGFLLHAELDTD